MSSESYQETSSDRVITMKDRPLLGMVYASMFGAVTAIGAFISIPLPFSPIPLTFHTLFMFLAAALLGGKLAALSQVVYIALGIIGLPVFAGGKAGLGVLLGPTGGYLIGFVAGAFVAGGLVRMRRLPGTVWIMLSLGAGLTVVYSLGVFQLAVTASLPLMKAVYLGVLPFIAADILKLIAAALITVRLRGLIRLP